MMKRIYIAGLDIDFTKAVTKANRGESIIIPSNGNGKPILDCWNISKNSEAGKQLQKIARKSGNGVVRFYSIKKGHICSLVVI